MQIALAGMNQSLSPLMLPTRYGPRPIVRSPVTSPESAKCYLLWPKRSTPTDSNSGIDPDSSVRFKETRSHRGRGWKNRPLPWTDHFFQIKSDFLFKKPNEKCEYKYNRTLSCRTSYLASLLTSDSQQQCLGRVAWGGFARCGYYSSECARRNANVTNWWQTSYKPLEGNKNPSEASSQRTANISPAAIT